MAKKEVPIEERVIYARERGDSFFDIKAEIGVPVAKARAIISAHAPHLLHNTLAVRRSWKAVTLFKQGKSYGKIGKALNISKNTAIRAVEIGLKSWDHRGMDIKRL